MNAVLKPIRTRIKKPKAPVPQSLGDANLAIHSIGIEQRSIDAAVLECESAIATLKVELAKQIAPHLERRKLQFDGIFAFAHANRARLTVESKTVVLTAGKFLWRWTPPAVAVESDEEMIKKLKSLGLKKYVRKIEELDRERLLANRAKVRVPGLSFTRREEFVVVPSGIDSTEIKKTKTIPADESE